MRASPSGIVTTTPGSGTQSVNPPTGPAAAAATSGPVSGTLAPAPASSRNWVLAFAALVVVLTLAGAGAYFYLHRTPKLTERDSILLTDFVNTTGESVFDGTLRQALAVDLEQSPYLNVFSEQKVQQTLKLMERPPDTRVTPEIGREICQRNGIKAMLTGNISSLGSQYVLTIQAVNSQTGDVLASEQTTAASKEQVLKSLDGAASDLRAKLGESLASIQKFDKPVEAATTSSLEALKAFSLGYAKHVQSDEAAALPLLKRAVGIDPNFAFAHAMLGTVYGNLGDLQSAEESIQKAYELRDRATAREKFYITAHHYDFGTGEIQKAIDTYKLWAQTYPRDFIPYDDLSVEYDFLGQYDQALEWGLKDIRLDPKDPYGYWGLAAAYFGQNRFDEAKAVIDQGPAQHADGPILHQFLYWVAFHQGDEAEMQRQAAWSKGKQSEPLMLMVQGNTQAYYGKLAKAREFYTRAVEVAQANGDAATAANVRAEAAMAEAGLGDFTNARKDAEAAVAKRKGQFMIANAAVALAMAGDASRALELSDADAKALPLDTVLNQALLPAVRALIDIQQDKPAAAIELLHSAEPIEMGTGIYAANLLPAYARGLAYLRARQGKEAVGEFGKFLANPGVAVGSPFAALARLGAARGYALAGEKDKARQEYQDFLALWKDADAGLPVLKEAEAEYARLQ
jgi:eukaryotic-like serine/threonine-protein kinase